MPILLLPTVHLRYVTERKLTMKAWEKAEQELANSSCAWQVKNVFLQKHQKKDHVYC